MNFENTDLKIEVIKEVVNSPYAPLAIVTIGILGAFVIFEYFEKVDKGMEHGYNISAISKNHGTISFTQNSEISQGMGLQIVEHE